MGSGEAPGVGSGEASGVLAVAWDGPAMLVRPDGHVAWVEAMGEAALQEALGRRRGPSFNE